MELITKKYKIDNIAKHWKQQYFHSGKWSGYEGEALEIYNALLSLGEGATEDDIEKIIGNRSWTKNMCDECGNDMNVLVVLGEPPDYESSTAHICPSCIEKASQMMRMLII